MWFELFEAFDKSTDIVSDPKNNDRTLSDILNDFEKSGGQVLGIGSYGKVLYHPKWKFVLKIFKHDDFYLKFVRFAVKNPRPSFPVFYDMPRKIIPNYKRHKNDPYLYVVKTEKLNSISKQEFMDIDYYKHYCNVDFSTLPDSYVWKEIKKKLEQLDKKYPSLKTFIDDYDFLQESGIEGADDWHQYNIMKRNNGQFVLIDPYWEGETPYQTYDRLVKGEIDYDRDPDDDSDKDMVKGGELYKKPKPSKPKKDVSTSTDDSPF